MRKSSKLNKLIGTLGIILVIYTIGTVIHNLVNQNIEMNTYAVSSTKLKQGTSLRIAVVSDLHSGMFANNQKKLILGIRDRKPDIIVLTGDIVDDDRPRKNVEKFLDGIKDVAPIYYVSGNHEFYFGKYPQVKNFLISHDVHVLDDEIVNLRFGENQITLAGIADPRSIKKSREQEESKKLTVLFKNISEDPNLTVLLAHRPERYQDYVEYGFDVAFSGHAHGGQIRIPYVLPGLVAPNQGLFPKRAGGLYVNGKMTHIVSRGLAVYPFYWRIFNNPEVCFVDISSKN